MRAGANMARPQSLTFVNQNKQKSTNKALSFEAKTLGPKGKVREVKP
jgi:hypothetical protein